MSSQYFHGWKFHCSIYNSNSSWNGFKTIRFTLRSLYEISHLLRPLWHSEDAFLPKKILFPLLAQGKPGFTRPGWLRLTRGSVKHLKHRKPFRFLDAIETSCSYPGISQGHRSSDGGTYSKSRLNAGASMLSLAGIGTHQESRVKQFTQTFFGLASFHSGHS